ncbi:hypothetical protein AGMMS49938_17710 [Fibrobacterales bacterium]|nr:hypothetical protein AGMMS49938_17710 [Fibrobacterales bacterium]
MREKVSIIVPIYNTSRYLSRCIDSLLSQSYTNIEVLLIDDGSTDGSENICDKYAKTDNRVKVIHKENGGEASARNAGLVYITGEYFMFCDSDDEYLPGSIEKLEKAMQIIGIDLAVGANLEKTGEITRLACTMQQRYTRNEIVNKILTDPNPYSTKYIMSTVNGTLFKTSIKKQHSVIFDENFVVGNDSLFVADYLKYCNYVFDIFDPVYVYYKYDETERIQGMSFVYPDEYKFTVMHYTKLLSILTANENKITYKQLLFDTIIRKLVCAMIYKEYFPDGLYSELEKLTNTVILEESANVYKRVRISDSEEIPLYFKNKDITSLYNALESRANLILQNFSKSTRVRLIYKNKEK